MCVLAEAGVHGLEHQKHLKEASQGLARSDCSSLYSCLAAGGRMGV